MSGKQSTTMEGVPSDGTTDTGDATGERPPAASGAEPPDGARAKEPAGTTGDRSLATLADFLKPVRGQMILVFLCGFISAALKLVPAIGVTVLAERALDGNLSSEQAWRWMLGIGVSLIVGHAIYLAATGYAHRVEATFRRNLRQRILDHMARLPLGWHSNESSGRVRTLVAEDTAKIHTLVAHFGSDFGAAVGGPVVGLVYLLTRSWLFALILAVWLFLVAGLFSYLANRANAMTAVNDRFMEAEKQLGAATVEMVDGITAVKAFGLDGARFKRFDRFLDQYTTAAYDWLSGSGRPSAWLTAFFSPAGMLIPISVIGFFLARAQVIDPIGILPFLLIGIGLPAGFLNVVMLFHNLSDGREAAVSIGTFLAEEELPEVDPDRAASIEDGTVEFNDVSFRYGASGPYAVEHVSLKLEPGTVTAVVGPSGSGKTTLVRLAARFWDVDEGAVTVGGADVRDVPSGKLLSHMAIVLQEGGIVTDTVSENIRMARPGASQEEVEVAARSARIHERIAALPHGYDTVLGTDGAHLSGGERQRIALARAFLADAPILLLDEATAQTDPHSEREIQEALAQLAQGRTVFVIAHRLATVVGADNIVVLDHGRIVEMGKHEQLLAAGGLYSQMWKAQQ
ncbi:MAG: ABC transporter ATP-binding protein [Actinomycetaceae bacterium]|nr:ABC transporter ATP-binding protein [Actinomycetaceae bacterium]